MRLLPHLPLGLIGRVFAILLLAVLIETGASFLLYERASQFSVRQGEAHRLAEHLVIARKLIEEAPAERRGAIAEELTTERYAVSWVPVLSSPPGLAPPLDRLTHQVVEWEPELKVSDLRLRVVSPGRGNFISGALRLSDSSWILFRTRQPVSQFGLTLSRILLALTPAAALILIGGLLLRQTLRPMRALARAAHRVGRGVVEPLPESGPAEVRHVIGAFNTMQSRIHRLLADRTQALAAVGHDFRTPLARLRLRADSIEDDGVRDAVQRDITEMNEMIDSLLAYLAGEADNERILATDIAVTCATLVDDAIDRGRIARYHGPEHCEIRIRPVAIKRALTNLIDNALHHATEVDVRLETAGDNLVIAIEDDGPGIPEEDRARVLEPFVRLDGARARDTQGFGLGLSIVQRAVDTEGGTLSLDNRPDGGLRASITLPRH